MAEIKQFIKSKTDKTKIYPRTLARAVYMGDGKTTVEESLDTKMNKTDIISMANMGQDVKEAMTGGSVAVVGDNAILENNIVDGQVTTKKINAIVKSANIFDKNNITEGQRLTGTVNTSTLENSLSTGWGSRATSEIIELTNPFVNNANIHILTNGKFDTCYLYDDNGILRGIKTFTENSGVYDFTVSTYYIIKYIRLDYTIANITNLNEIMVCIDELPTKYIPYGEYITLNGCRVAKYDEVSNIPFVEESTSIFVGENSGINNVEGYNDIFDNGRYNAGFGVGCMKYNISGDHCTAIGYQALMKNTEGNYNTALGEDTLFENTSGVNNTAVGTRVMQNCKTGNRNVGIGSGTGLGLTTGNNNTIIGTNAGNEITNEDGNTLLGYWTKIVKGVTNGIAIGRSAIVEKSNTARIGNNTLESVETYGDFEVLNSEKGFVLSSPSGNKFRIKIDDEGNLITNKV